MPLAPERPDLPEALPRLRLGLGSVVLRSLAVAAATFGVALACGAPGPVAALLMSIAVSAMFVERILVRQELATKLQASLRSARAEGERDAMAHSMSIELAHERSRSVLEALREGVLVVDGHGEIVLANPAARRAMRAPLLDPRGQMLWDALMPELAQRAREAWQALHAAVGHRDELPQVRYAAIPCRDAVYDLTAVEATSQRTGQDFGSVFLLVDSTRAHELQRLKDRFLSSVSHELRTPLTNICAYAEILRNLMPGESAEWPEFVRVVHEEGLQLSQLVDGMFDFLQLESGEATFASELIEPQPIVAAAVDGFRQQAAARGIALELVTSVEVPQLIGDRRRFQQVVMRLCDNAIKFTPAKGTVRVSIGARDEAFELRVEDSGPGVPPTDRQAVFEKFHQLRDHLTDKPTGTGLGLATSRAIVARFGGLIWCEDSLLGGASFVVMLPSVGQPRMAAFGAGTGAGGGF